MDDLTQRFLNGRSRPGTGSRKQTAGSPKYFYLIFDFITSRVLVNKKQHYASYLIIIGNVDFFSFLEKCFYIIIHEKFMDIHTCFMLPIGP